MLSGAGHIVRKEVAETCAVTDTAVLGVRMRGRPHQRISAAPVLPLTRQAHSLSSAWTGPGVLGSYLGKVWLEQHPGARVVGQTNTDTTHERWGIPPLQPLSSCVHRFTRARAHKLWV